MRTIVHDKRRRWCAALRWLQVNKGKEARRHCWLNELRVFKIKSRQSQRLRLTLPRRRQRRDDERRPLSSVSRAFLVGALLTTSFRPSISRYYRVSSCHLSPAKNFLSRFVFFIQQINWVSLWIVFFFCCNILPSRSNWIYEGTKNKSVKVREVQCNRATSIENFQWMFR